MIEITLLQYNINAQFKCQKNLHNQSPSSITSNNNSKGNRLNIKIGKLEAVNSTMEASRDPKQSVGNSATPPLELILCRKIQGCMKTVISDRNFKSILRHSNNKFMMHFKMQKKYKWNHGSQPNEN